MAGATRFLADKASVNVTLLTLRAMISPCWPRLAAATTTTPDQRPHRGRHGDPWSRELHGPPGRNHPAMNRSPYRTRRSSEYLRALAHDEGEQ